MPFVQVQQVLWEFSGVSGWFNTYSMGDFVATGETTPSADIPTEFLWKNTVHLSSRDRYTEIL